MTEYVQTALDAGEKVSVTDQCAIVHLKVCQWGGTKLDRKESNDLLIRKMAGQGSAKVEKSLLGDDIKPINTIVNTIRTTNKAHTLPYDDNARRILPSSYILEHKQIMEGLARELSLAVAKLIKDWPLAMARAQSRLAGLYDPTDYPDVSEIPAKFSMDVRYHPIPKGEHFAFDASDEIMRELKAQCDSRHEEQFKQAHKNLYEQLNELTKAFEEAMAKQPYEKVDKDGNVRVIKPKFQTTTLTKIEELANRIPKLNLTGDKNIEELANSVKSTLLTHESSELRNNPSLREKKAIEARAQIDKIQDAMKGVY